MRIPSGVTYDSIKVGDVFEHRLTVTETHLVTAAGMFGDLILYTLMNHLQPTLYTELEYSMGLSQPL